MRLTLAYTAGHGRQHLLTGSRSAREGRYGQCCSRFFFSVFRAEENFAFSYGSSCQTPLPMCMQLAPIAESEAKSKSPATLSEAGAAKGTSKAEASSGSAESSADVAKRAQAAAWKSQARKKEVTQAKPLKSLSPPRQADTCACPCQPSQRMLQAILLLSVCQPTTSPYVNNIKQLQDQYP